MSYQTASSASSTSRSDIMPISTMGQGQAMLMAQATPSAQVEDRARKEGTEVSLSEKGTIRPSMRSALSSIKIKAKRLSFSSSASGKDNATLVDVDEYEKRDAKEEKRKAENEAVSLGKKGVGKGGV